VGKPRAEPGPAARSPHAATRASIQRARLVGELRHALLAELGARAIYRRLERLVRDGELARVLAGFAQEEERQIELLHASLGSLGAGPARGSLRRTLLAEALAWTSPIVGIRPVLRICLEAEDASARRYAYFQEHLAGLGEGETALACGELALTKRRHAQALYAWVENAPRR
jgi:rubrerythrin